jgi:beta propeller repeat protein
MGVRLPRATRWLLPLSLVLLLPSCGGKNVVTVVGLSDSDQQVPAINGTLVAWEDYRNADADGADVYARDMTSPPGNETLIAGGNGDQSQPAVSDQFIVWVDNGAIRAKARAGGGVINVATGNGDKFDPAVCGNFVVWTDMRNGNPDIYGRDLAGGQELPITSTPAAEAYPDCDGNRVVYMSIGATTGADISMFDRTTGATTVVSAQPWNEWMPAISGDRMVWQGWPGQGQPNATIQIFGVDLSTGAPIDVTHGSGNQRSPDISATIVVWQDDRGKNPELWYLDLASGAEGPVVDTGGTAPPEVTPQVSGRSVVWQQQINGSWDIELKQL